METDAERVRAAQQAGRQAARRAFETTPMLRVAKEIEPGGWARRYADDSAHGYVYDLWKNARIAYYDAYLDAIREKLSAEE